MALPPLAVTELPGMSVYPAQSGVEDKIGRGAFTGARVDRHTYVFERPGKVEIPGASVQWWNPEGRQLQQVEIESLTVEVMPNPAMGGAAPGWVDQLMRRPLLAAAALLAPVLLLWSLYRYGERWRARWQGWRRRRSESEVAHFQRLVRLCREGRPGPAYNAVAAWVARRGLGPAPEVRRALAGAGASGELMGEMERLQLAVAGRDSDWEGRALETLLRAFRTGLARIDRRPAAALPGLNPRGSQDKRARGYGMDALPWGGGKAH